MRFFLLAFIQIYWILVQPSKRRKCIFRKSCSQHVFESTIKDGLNAGLEAFKFRYKNCSHGFELFKNPIDGRTRMILRNHQIIDEDDIAERLIKRKI